MSFRHELIMAFGSPIDENPTGLMMDAAFQNLTLNWRYQLIHVKPPQLKEALTGFKAMNIAGANFTIPFKEEVIQYLDKLDTSAQIIGAVNTAVWQDGLLIGYNTDGKGFVQALKQEGIKDLTAQNIVIIGAGGAARAIAVEAALSGAKNITFINRTRSRVDKLITSLQNQIAADLQLLPWGEEIKIPEDTDIIVNATSMGLFPNTAEAPPLAYQTITDNMVVVDVIPNPPHTHFLKLAARQNAHTITGSGMLIQQAAIAFELWTGKKAPVATMSDALYNIFK